MDLREVVVEPVATADESRYQRLMQAHHYLGRLAQDRRDAVVRGALAARVGGTDRLFRAGLEVPGAGRLDRLGLPGAVRPVASGHRQQPLSDPARLASAQPGLATAVAVRAVPGLGLAETLRPSAAAAGDLRRPVPLPGHHLPRIELVVPRAHPRLPPRPRRLQRHPHDPEARLRPSPEPERASAADQ